MLRKNKWRGVIILTLMTLLLAAIALCAGASGFGAGASYEIVLHIRLPRVLGAWLCGAALAVAGLLLQAALGNALASPGVIGVNSGAGFAVVLISALIPELSAALRLGAAFLGALGAALTVYGIAQGTGASRGAIVLAGVALSSLLSAGTDAVTTIVPDALFNRTAFYVGGFGGVYMKSITPVTAPIIIGIMAAYLMAGRVNIMLLGDEVAASLGLDVKKFRFLCIICASLLAASAVGVCGLLGFVGLIAPHVMRLIFGGDYRSLTPLAALGGGFLVLFCDTVARVAFAPYELPVGIPLSALGAPFFIWLLLKRKGGLSI